MFLIYIEEESLKRENKEKELILRVESLMKSVKNEFNREREKR